MQDGQTDGRARHAIWPIRMPISFYYNAWKVCLFVCLLYLSDIFYAAWSQTPATAFESLNLGKSVPTLPYISCHGQPEGGVDLPGNGVDSPLGWKLC